MKQELPEKICYYCGRNTTDYEVEDNMALCRDECLNEYKEENK